MITIDVTNQTVTVYSGNESTTQTSIGVRRFIDLSDAPSQYAGGAGKAIAVNSTETGLEFVDFSSASSAGLTESSYYSVEGYGAVHDGRTVGDGAITSGQNTLTSATGLFLSTDIGKLILIAGAGVAGAALKTTIATYVSATQVTLTVAASTTVTGKKVDWGTDDSSAIQSAINACITGGGGTVYFPNGIYLINSSLYTGGTNPNSQIYFPSSSMVQTRVSINLLGESNVTMAGTYIAGEITTSGVILQSTLIASEVSGTVPSILATLTSATVANGSTYNENWNYIFMQNMGFRTYTNGGQSHKMGAVNLAKAAKVSSRNCSFLADYSVDLMVSPSGSSTFGFIACAGNDWAPNVIEENYAGGFEYGFAFGEHTSVDSIYSIGNYYGVAFFTGQYAITGKVLTHACVSQLYFQGLSTLLGVPSIANSVYVDIFLEAEQVGTALWWGATTFFTDTNGTAYGKVNYGGYQPTPIWDTYTGGSWLMKTQWFTPLPKRFSMQGPVGVTGGYLAQTTHYVQQWGPTTPTSIDTTYHNIQICCAWQNGISNLINQRMIYNFASATGVPLYDEQSFTDGAVASGIGRVEEHWYPSGVDTITTVKRPTYYQHKVPQIYDNSISPAALAANTDNYAPTGIATAITLRISATSAFDLTGIAGGATMVNGRELILINVGTTNTITLKNDVTSTAANRFLLNADFALVANMACKLVYDGTSSRWRKLY